MHKFVANRLGRKEVVRLLLRNAVGNTRETYGAVDVQARRMNSAMHELVGARFRESPLRKLGSVIRGVLRRTTAALRAEYENNRTSSALSHFADYRLRRIERSIAIDLQLKIEFFLGDVCEWLAKISPGVVDQNRNRSQLPLDC